MSIKQLSKKQMNALKGGVEELNKYYCVAFVNGEKVEYYISAKDYMAAADRVHGDTGADQVNCVLQRN